jgi:hypothetical protein
MIHFNTELGILVLVIFAFWISYAPVKKTLTLSRHIVAGQGTSRRGTQHP